LLTDEDRRPKGASSERREIVADAHGRWSWAALLATMAITIAVFVPLIRAFYLAAVEAVSAGHWIVHAVAAAGGANAFVAQLPAVVRDRRRSCCSLRRTR
jgi:hypothetical protein